MLLATRVAAAGVCVLNHARPGRAVEWAETMAMLDPASGNQQPIWLLSCLRTLPAD